MGRVREEWRFPIGRALRTDVFLSVRKTEKPLFLPLQLSALGALLNHQLHYKY